MKHALQQWSNLEPTWEPIDEFLGNQYQVLRESGRTPVMRNFEGGCNAPSGFAGYFSTDSVNAYAESSENDAYDVHSSLADSFRWAVKNERSAVEVRIQMRHPELYAEIDRLKVEAELRRSISPPLGLLCILLGWAWSPWCLLALVALPFMLRDGRNRESEAAEKTWGALIAGEVASPAMDAMVQEQECRDFQSRYTLEPSSAAG